MKKRILKSIRILLATLSCTLTILSGLFDSISSAEIAASSEIPIDLIARKIKKHDPALAITVAAVLYKARQNRDFTLVDVRSRQDFERQHIPGSVNIALYAVKTKSYLKSVPVVLVNRGFQYGPLESECRRLIERGFQAFILDGGLPAWKRQRGQLLGDLFVLDEMLSVMPQAFYREKDYDNTLVIDISPQRSKASSRLIPYAKHIPVLGEAGAAMPGLRKLIGQHRPFSPVIVFNETGEKYERVNKIFNPIGLDVYYLQGEVAGYQKYLEGLLLSWKSRDHRIKKVGNCRACGEKPEK